MKILCRSLVVATFLAAMAACGKTGPLYLPDTEPASGTSGSSN